MATSNPGPGVSANPNEMQLRSTYDINGKLLQILGPGQTVAYDPANVAISGGAISVANGSSSAVSLVGLGDNLNLTATPDSTGTRYNSYTESNALAFGREYLWQWYKSWRISPSQTPSVLLSGDSTTLGNNISTAAYQPGPLLAGLAKARSFGITATVSAFFGKSTADWLATYLTADLAGAAPAVYVIRWGMNDAFYGITAAQTLTNIRIGLARIRATAGWDYSVVGIVLCTPNTSSDDAAGRNELWHEQVGAGFRQAARDYGAAFVDNYAIARTARNQVPTINGSWLDAAFVHPNEDHSLLLIEALADMLFPRALSQIRAAPLSLTPASGYTQPSSNENASSRIEGAQVILNGYFNGPGAAVASGTIVATIAAQHRPTTTYFLDAFIWNGGASTSAASWQTVPVLIDGSGNVITMVLSTLTVSRFYFNKISLYRF